MGVFVLASSVASFSGLALLGYSTLEKTEVPESTETIGPTLQKGLNRVEYTSKGTKVVANLFIPSDYEEGQQRPAIVVSPPATSVKEQSNGNYAKKLCEFGYITLAFDPRGIGESDGIESDTNGYHFANDIASWITYLTSLKEVDSDQILSLGLCHGGMASAYEVISDPRVKALAMVAPSINGAELTMGTYLPIRWMLYAIGGIAVLFNSVGVNIKGPAIPDAEGLKNADAMMKDIAGYYPEGKPGFHPRWKNFIAVSSLPSVAAMHIFDYADQFDDIPVCVVTGENAGSREPAMRFYDKLKGPKESLIIDDCTHADLYWKPDKVDQAAAKVDEFFKKHLPNMSRK